VLNFRKNYESQKCPKETVELSMRTQGLAWRKTVEQFAADEQPSTLLEAMRGLGDSSKQTGGLRK